MPVPDLAPRTGNDLIPPHEVVASPCRETEHALGLDIGGTKLAVGVVDGHGRVQGQQVEPTHRGRGPEEVIRRLFAMGQRAIAWSGTRPTSVGISCGGPLDADAGILLSPPHLPGWDEVPLGDLARAEFGLPTVLQNDATAAALGEYRHGAGAGTSTMLYLTLSTGVGGGAIVDGKLMRGAAANGGEFGHLSVLPGGRSCSCGRRGCLEAYCSGTSIALRAAERQAREPRGALAALEHSVTAADVAAGVRSGDPLCIEIWDETLRHLATALTDLVNAFEPDMVVLGGGVTRSGDILLPGLREQVLRDAMAPAARSVQLRLTALGDLVGVVGAGTVAHLTERETLHAH